MADARNITDTTTIQKIKIAIRDLVKVGVSYSNHALQRMEERQVTTRMVVNLLRSGEVVTVSATNPDEYRVTMVSIIDEDELLEIEAIIVVRNDLTGRVYVVTIYPKSSEKEKK